MYPGSTQQPWVLYYELQLVPIAHPFFPHRTLLPNGTMGPVLPAFDCRLQANHRSSLRDDLALYDIILFIALGFSIDVSCRCSGGG